MSRGRIPGRPFFFSFFLGGGGLWEKEKEIVGRISLYTFPIRRFFGPGGIFERSLKEKSVRVRIGILAAGAVVVYT